MALRNYNPENICAFSDLAEIHTPLGHNYRALIASEYKTWAKANDRPCQDKESLRNKFDKLTNTKKPTGDSSFPPCVRRAKHLAREIHNVAASRSRGAGNEENSLPNVDSNSDCMESEYCIGMRQDKKQVAAGGLKTSARSPSTKTCLWSVLVR